MRSVLLCRNYDQYSRAGLAISNLATDLRSVFSYWTYVRYSYIMGDGGTTVAIVFAGLLGAVLVWIGVHFLRKRITQQRVDEAFQENYGNERGKSDQRSQKSWRDQRDGRRRTHHSRWDDFHGIPPPELFPPLRPFDIAPPQPPPPQESAPEHTRTDYIAEVDILPPMIFGERNRRASSTESSSSDSSESEAGRHGSSRPPDDEPNLFRGCRDDPWPRNTAVPRAHIPRERVRDIAPRRQAMVGHRIGRARPRDPIGEIEMNGLRPPLRQPVRRGRGERGGRLRYADPHPHRRRLPNKNNKRLATSNTPP